jgi:metal-sulfur cluster biosynthetic enzyme
MTEATDPPPSESSGLSRAIIHALRTVHDPCCEERGISVVDMGLVRSVSTAEPGGGDARVELLLTSGWCPFAANLVGAIRERVESLPEIGEARVEIVWDEPWTADRLSDDARRKLRFLPDPKEVRRDR